MNLRLRLVLTLVAISLLMALPALYAATQLLELRQVMGEAQRRHGEAYLAMGQVQARLAEFDRLQRSYIALQTEDIGVRKDTAIAQARAHLRTLAAKGYGKVAAPAAAVVERLESESKRIDVLMRSGRSAQATAELDRIRPLLAQAELQLRAISQEIDESSASHLLRATLITAAANTTTLLALGVAILMTFALGAWITSNMVQPITQLRQAMARVAGGDFHVPDSLPYARRDEIGHVSRSFRGMTSRLEELEKLRAEFMSISTHELKTPINVISGYAELMHERVLGDVTPKQSDALASIREQTRLLTQMVNQLLDMSRIEAGGFHLEIADVDLPDMFERLERTFQALARKEDVVLRVELAPDAPRQIPGDADRLRDQVLGNIISNALKFTPRGGKVDVRGLHEGDWVRIDVEDSGTGIPAAELPLVFDKFYQVGDQARSKGAGLGLAIAHEVVSGHGGRITVDSTQGVGTCFTILLPTTRERAEQAQLERRERRVAAAAAAARDA
jgi:signal transduction histidine kinase